MPRSLPVPRPKPAERTPPAGDDVPTVVPKSATRAWHRKADIFRATDGARFRSRARAAVKTERYFQPCIGSWRALFRIFDESTGSRCNCSLASPREKRPGRAELRHFVPALQRENASGPSRIAPPLAEGIRQLMEEGPSYAPQNDIIGALLPCRLDHDRITRLIPIRVAKSSATP